MTEFSVSEKNYIVEMDDGSKWAVPVMQIARSRAEYYAVERGEFDGDIMKSLEEDTLPLFQADPYEIHDWASGNMNWEDVADSAKLIENQDRTPDFQDGWMNGEWEVA